MVSSVVSAMYAPFPVEMSENRELNAQQRRKTNLQSHRPDQKEVTWPPKNPNYQNL